MQIKDSYSFTDSGVIFDFSKPDDYRTRLVQILLIFVHTSIMFGGGIFISKNSVDLTYLYIKLYTLQGFRSSGSR